MKPFSSSILMMTESSKTTQSSVKSLPQKESYLIQMLQFNEAAAKADLQSTRDYYLGLLNLANRETTKFDPAINAAFNQYEAVTAAASHIMWDDESSNREFYDLYHFDEIVTRANKILSKNPQKINIISDCCTSVPVRIDSAVSIKPFKEFCDAVITALQEHKFAEFASEAELKYSSSEMIKYFSEMFGIENCNSLEEFIDEYKSKYKFEPFEVYIGSDIRSIMYSATDKVYCNRLFHPVGNLMGCADSMITVLRVNTDDLNPNDVRKVIKLLCDSIVLYTIMNMKINQIVDDIAKRVTLFNCKSVSDALHMGFDFSENPVIESAFEMFGDKVDLETIFDTLDPYDFNPTEFVDISLVTDHMQEIDMIEAAKYATIASAKLLAEGKYDQLQTVHEALSQKIKEGFHKIIEAIKKMLSKFAESILFNIGTEKAWLEKYKNTILNNTFDRNQQVTIYCDLDSAMSRIEGVVPPTISYQQLVAEVGKDIDTANNNENTNDAENKFFEHYFTSLAGAINPNSIPTELRNWNGYQEASRVDKIKWALGAKWPDGVSRDVAFGDLKIKDMYDWLLKTERLAKTTQQQITNIERTIKNYEASANAAAKNQPTRNPQEANDSAKPQEGQTPAANQEASLFNIHSYVLTEADLKDPPPTNNNNNQDGNNNQQPSNPKPDTLNKTRGDTDAEVKRSGDPSQVDKIMQIYLNVCKDVLAAKITAINYAHKEMLDIMRFIVKAKLGNSADLQVRDNNKTNNEMNNNTNQTNNNENPQKAKVTVKRKK